MALFLRSHVLYENEEIVNSIIGDGISMSFDPQDLDGSRGGWMIFEKHHHLF